MGHILYVALGMGMASCGDDSVRVEKRQRRDRERTEKGLFGRREGEKNLRKYLKMKSEKLFGSQELAAPQATLMKVIVEGIMDGNLPWGLIGIGAFISLAVELLGVSSLAVAIGLYLPIEITASTMLGGMIRLIVDKKKAKAEDSDEGILFCSGIIAGEGLVGILIAVLAVTHIDKIIDLSGTINTGIYGGFVILAIIIALVMKYGFKKSTE